MLHKIKNIKGYKLDSLDGEIGKVKDFYLDDKYWTIRYLVADTGAWLTDKQVLISPYALVAINKENQNISVNLTKEQIENSPPLESEKLVSQQFEEDYYGYYGWPAYWGGGYMWGMYPYIIRDYAKVKKDVGNAKEWDHHLRSTLGVSGYYIQATDEEIGHVDDFIIDDETWAIRYLVVATHNWWPGKKVLVSPQWIERISWNESKVFVKLTREMIKQSPEYSEEFLLTRDYETILHQHYNHQGYWVDESAVKDHEKQK